MPYFEITGTSTKTGRPIKPKTLQAFTEAKAQALAEEAGMTVESVTQLPEQEPTEKQIDYARDLGVSIPISCTRREISDLIDYALWDDEPADSELLALADRYEIEYTQYVGCGKLYDKIWNSPAVIGTKIAALFTYCLYRDLLPKRITPVATTPEHPSIQEIASKVVLDPKLMESIYRYKGNSLAFFGQKTLKNGDLIEGGSNRTKAYKEISAYLRQDPTFGIPFTTEKKSATSGKLKSKTAASAKSGCAIAIFAVGIVCMLVIGAVAAALR